MIVGEWNDCGWWDLLSASVGVGQDKVVGVKVEWDGLCTGE